MNLTCNNKTLHKTEIVNTFNVDKIPQITENKSQECLIYEYEKGK